MSKMVRFLKATGKSALRLTGTAASCAGGAFVGKTVYDHTGNPTVATAAGVGTAAVGTITINAVIDSCSKPNYPLDLDEVQEDIDDLMEDVENLYNTSKEINADVSSQDAKLKELEGLCDAHSEAIAKLTKNATYNSKQIESIMKEIANLPAMAETVETLSDMVFKETMDGIKSEAASSHDDFNPEDKTSEELEKDYHVKPDKSAKGKNKRR